MRRWGVLAIVVLGTACASTDAGSSDGAAAVTTRPTIDRLTTTTTTTSTQPTTTRPPAPTTPATGAPRVPAGADTTVERVVDGDTIVVAGGVRVRLIGIDTPETVDPRQPVQCFGREASRRASELLAPGTAVRLVFDVERYDRYDRTLAYVYRRADGRFVNEAMVREGYAFVSTYPPNVRHADDFVRWQAEARDAGRGLWSACPVAPAAPLPIAPGGGNGACDAAYPDACIPPPPPDLDCRDVTPRRFRVLSPDPHRFDGDADGVGCES